MGIGDCNEIGGRNLEDWAKGSQLFCKFVYEATCSELELRTSSSFRGVQRDVVMKLVRTGRFRYLREGGRRSKGHKRLKQAYLSPITSVT